VRAFLDKAHEKMVAEVRNSMEDEAMLYEAISASNIRASTAKTFWEARLRKYRASKVF
jgi:hypothetical protein